jgi:hypothetical protein
MATNVNMKKGLKRKSGNIPYSSSWIAGADHDITIENEENGESLKMVKKMKKTLMLKW